MAFAYALIKRYRGVLGKLSIVLGTYTMTGATVTGSINTGLNHCHFMKLISSGAAVIADEPVVNASFETPVYGKSIAIFTTALATGWFIAIGT